MKRQQTIMITYKMRNLDWALQIWPDFNPLTFFLWDMLTYVPVGHKHAKPQFSVTVCNHNTPKPNQSLCWMTVLGGLAAAAASLQRSKSENIKMKNIIKKTWCSLMQLERKVAKGLVNPDNLSSLSGGNERNKNGA